MNKHMIKVTSTAALLMGIMGTVNAAHAAGGNATSLLLQAQVSKTTCEVDVNGSSGTTSANFGSFLPADIFAYNATNKLSYQSPMIISFKGCSGEDVAADGVVKIQADGTAAAGSNALAFGDAATNKQYGFDLALTWANSDASVTTATSATLNPGNTSAEIFKAKAESTVDDLATVLPVVTVTPQLFSWATVVGDIGTSSLNTPVALSIAYN